jgi:hypothetical protein
MNYQTCLVRIPPWLPIPGTDIIRADNRTAAFELPTFMGPSFPQLCKLTSLISEMLHAYYDSGDGVAPTERAPFDFAQHLYYRLLGWADALPVSMARSDDMPHHVAIVHIVFHAAVLDLFRPFRYQIAQTPYLLERFAARHPTPEGICDASVSQLKHLVLVFWSRYSCATSTMLWQNALLYVANECLPLRQPAPPTAGATEAHDGGSRSTDEMDDVGNTEILDDETATAGGTDESEEEADRRKWFTACIEGFGALAPQFPLAAGIVQGILSMAMTKGSIPAVEGRAIMGRLKADVEASRPRGYAHLPSSGSRAGDSTQAMAMAVMDASDDHDEEGEGEAEGGLGGGAAQVQATAGGGVFRGFTPAHIGCRGFVIDLNEASINPSGASLNVLGRAFDELAMFDEFTTGGE